MTTLLLLGLFGQAAIQASGGLNWPVGEGNLRGVLVDFNREGWPWQTFEGKLQSGPDLPVAPEGFTFDYFRFSVSDLNVAEQLELARVERRQVIVHYRRYALRGWNKGATEFDVYRVDFLRS
jgi:hypothetical protein